MNLSTLFDIERDIPYRIPLTKMEVDQCCSGKHERLMEEFRHAGFECRYRICWFKWSDIALPPDVASVPHDDDCTHVYLEVNIDGTWKIVDATWDPGLRSIFPVNEWIDGEEMTVAVPSRKTLSPEDSEEYMQALTSEDIETDMKKHHDFYQVFNEWLENARSA